MMQVRLSTFHCKRSKIGVPSVFHPSDPREISDGHVSLLIGLGTPKKSESSAILGDKPASEAQELHVLQLARCTLPVRYEVCLPNFLSAQRVPGGPPCNSAHPKTVHAGRQRSR